MDETPLDPSHPADDGRLPGSAPDAAAGARLVRCRMCGRPLTGTGSRRTGLGPACDAKLHPPAPDIRTRRREAEQDPLPGI
ncbi:DUF6011 domain-containing protein [Streptomyces sp. JV176]|uniref:DUF6011 domain-containing protein n=1 Tax=Streptomyces sp. JV176 TaxID=858630 RepID=UPI002E78126E|nr:DUF6011 domain-containing protein [Streptomyces sp. JV176]MEE1801040.1 DUF6011 domain-containing protein [Streptomyces sp. JV176]